MYPEEITLDDHTNKTLDKLRKTIDHGGSSDFSIAPTISLVLELRITDDDTSQSQTIRLDLTAPFTYEGSQSPDEPPNFKVRIQQPSWLNRAATSQLQDAVPEGEDLLSTIEHVKEAAARAHEESLQSRIPSTASATDSGPLVRVWFYFPSISTRSKRDDFIKFAPAYNLTGFLYAGKPGLLCVEGGSQSIDEYMRFIKTESWGDIPAHHKKVSERYRETADRVFGDMTEITDTVGERRGQRQNRGDMKAVEEWLDERGLKEALTKVLMFDLESCVEILKQWPKSDGGYINRRGEARKYLQTLRPDLDDSASKESVLRQEDRYHVFLNTNVPFSTFICGVQGSGKSHTTSCFLENAVLLSPNIGHLESPVSTLVFSYDGSLNYLEFNRRLAKEKFDPTQTAMLKMRMNLLESFLDLTGTAPVPSFKPGELTIIDLSDPFLTASTACVLFKLGLEQFLQSRAPAKMVVLDEAHKYMLDTPGSKILTDHLTRVIRLQRHQGARVIISTQEPTIATELIALCSVTVMHRFTSPAWYIALRKHINAVDDDKEIMQQIENLETGEALVYSPNAVLGKNDDGSLIKATGRLLRLNVRNRVTLDGGASIMAV
ncbi:hypothetical protein SLS59_005152 [Nothophoma quercina]|uniref:Uncharacterized protein n=1 Tax=Nothophoma quercina TaxID=749835 RepID=A0ABR3RC24_9PLEO